MKRNLQKIEFERDEALRFRHPELTALVEAWREKCRGRPVPDREDFDAFFLRPYLPQIIIYDRAGAPLPRYRFRLYGTQISQFSGRDPTGRFLDEVMDAPTLRIYDSVLDWVLTNQRPLRTTGALHYLDRGFAKFESANLPVSVRSSGPAEQVLSVVFYRDAGL